jgi:hypothetical protein
LDTPGVVEMIESVLCYIGKNWLALASFLVSGAALIITWIKNVRDRTRADDKELLEHLKFSLEQAYGAVARSGEDGEVPRKDRLGWISGARHLIRYWELRRSLKTALFKTICEELEEYWRHRFYLLLCKIDSSRFFVWINQEQMNEETVEPISAAIVFAFSQWKEDLPDPLDSWTFEQIVSQYKLFSPRNRHFKEFIESKFPNLAEKAKGGS